MKPNIHMKISRLSKIICLLTFFSIVGTISCTDKFDEFNTDKSQMMEVGTKLLTDGKKDEAKEMFDGAYKMYSMFWALRFGIMKAEEIAACAISEKEDENKPMTLEDITSKLVDCCKE